MTKAIIPFIVYPLYIQYNNINCGIQMVAHILCVSKSQYKKSFIGDTIV